MAIAVAAFALNSGEAFVGVAGPLIEVPALIWLVNVASCIQRRYFCSAGLRLAGVPVEDGLLGR